MADIQFTTEDLSQEVWKEIERHPKYFVSNFGRIKNRKEHVLKPFVDRDGYYKVNLRGEVRRNYFVHQLVMRAFFFRLREDNEVVNHIDHQKANNRIGNLEYTTQKENVRKAIQAGRWESVFNAERKRVTGDAHWARKYPEKVKRGADNNNAKLSEDQVKEIRRLYAVGQIGMRPLADQFGLSRNAIRQIIRRVLWKHVE